MSINSNSSEGNQDQTERTSNIQADSLSKTSSRLDRREILLKITERRHLAGI